MNRHDLTKTQREQVEALDAYCDELGLPRGDFRMGGKHGIYEVTLPNGKTAQVSVACTPRNTGDAICITRKAFRHNIARVMEWT